VRADLAENSRLIERETGRRPRAIVWPYGSYNLELVRIAGELGMPIALTLDGGANGPGVPLHALRRILVVRNPELGEYAGELRGPRYPPAERVIEVDLDDVYDPDPARQESNLSTLVERIQAFNPSHVYLHAFSSREHASGDIGSAYFPNRTLALRADLFNRAAWQLGTRSGVHVFAVVPPLDLPPRVRLELLEDLARSAKFAGVVFDDGARSSDTGEAASAFIRQAVSRILVFRAPLQVARATTMQTGGAAPQLAEWLAAYDYVVLRVGGAVPDPRQLRPAEARGKLVYLLPSERSAAPETSQALARRLRALQLGGALRFGYAPDDFLHDIPALAQIAPVMALRVHPKGPQR